jgi:pyridoxal phosphate enzyme (YggS family)
MSTIRDNLDTLRTTIPAGVKLVAVSKMQPLERIQEVYAAGQRRFGENRVQDLVAKQPLLPQDIEWHFIGHLQTNTVKFIAPFVDSLRLLCEIDREAARIDRIIDGLLQLYIATEETKFGLDISEARALLSSPEYKALHNIHITGVMGMATYTPEVALVEREFGTLKAYFDVLFKEFFTGDDGFREISMGMSGDYLTAIAQGSTMVRIGSAIFEE